MRGVAAGIILVAGSLTSGLTGAGAATAPSEVWTWGANGYGQLGNGTTSSSASRPAQVGGLSDIIDVHGGREHVVALSSGGTVYTWGSNQQGQLGLGDSANRPSPTPVPGLCTGSGVEAVETGHNSTLALCADGTVWAWGLNANGQLGDGSTTLRRSPVRVSGLSDAVAIAAGRDMAYAVRSGGTVVAWGDNAFGELGNGSTMDRSTPVAVTGLSDVTAIAAGRNHGLAVHEDGTISAFGANAYGQVGDGSTTNRATPVDVSGLSGVIDVIAGAHHSYALRSNGQVSSWGRNYRAALGDGTTTTRTRPVTVQGVTGAVSIGSARDHGVAVLGNGTVMTWGNNAQGQLGDGTTTTRSTAVPVPGVANASKAGGGGAEYSVVLVSDDDTPTPNSPPTASITSSCDGLTCSFGGGGSADSDGSIDSYLWDFGDQGAGASTATATHTYAVPGTYTVTLTVTDDDGATGRATRQVTVSDAPSGSVTYVSKSTFSGNVRYPTVTVPTGLDPDDRLLLFVSINRNGTASAPAGWAQVGTVLDGTDLESWVFSRSAVTAGTSVRVTLNAISKSNLTLLAYAGAGPPSAVVGSAKTGTSSTSHRTPSAAVATGGSTVVSFWADKVSQAHGWTLPATITSRSATVGSGSGMITTAAGDTTGVGPGSWPGATAQAIDVPSSKAVSWTVVLPPS